MIAEIIIKATSDKKSIQFNGFYKFTGFFFKSNCNVNCYTRNMCRLLQTIPQTNARYVTQRTTKPHLQLP